MGLSRSHRILGAAVAMAAAGVGAVLFAVDPARTGLFPPCPFHWATGCYCPGCGSLRALHQLLHLKVGAAWRLNPLMVISLPILALAMLERGPVARAFRQPAAPWVAAVVLVGFGVLRNLPGFEGLAPH